MTASFRISNGCKVFLALGIAAPMLAGCVRTEDGTLLMTNRPMFAFRATDPARYSSTIRERREREARTDDFPHPPRNNSYRWRANQERTPPPKIGPVRVGVAPPFKSAPGQNKNLTCRNETTANGRVKVACD